MLTNTNDAVRQAIDASNFDEISRTYWNQG
jgi:hypothetical protein